MEISKKNEYPRFFDREIVVPDAKVKSKYDSIINEVINKGCSYKDYLKRANLKVYRGTLTFKKPSFQKPKNIE